MPVAENAHRGQTYRRMYGCTDGTEFTGPLPALPGVQKGVFLNTLLGTLASTLLGNMLAVKGIVRAGYGNKQERGIVRAGYGSSIKKKYF